MPTDLAVYILTNGRFHWYTVGNQIFNGNPHGAEQGLEGLPAEDAQMRESGLLSLYDLHSDRSGVCYSSSRRPLLNLRPVRPPTSLDFSSTLPSQRSEG